jgi:hypothetical protein
MQQIELNQFPNIGYLSVKLTNEQVAPILDEVRELEKDFTTGIVANQGLAGNIKKEFTLVKSKEYIEKLVLPLLIEYDKNFHYTPTLRVLTDSLPICLHEAWVNFQEKGEFNPMHNHSGVYSFVLWLQIPYYIQDEINLGPGKLSQHPVAGHFEFQYTSSVGRIMTYAIPADKTFENRLILFPATLTHGVYPFYTSDKYRISVSGNFSLNSSQP